MARRPELAAFADDHGLVAITVADVMRHRRRTEMLLRREAAARVPNDHGEFTAIAYRSGLDGTEHMALVLGDVDQAEGAVPVRVHSECLTGDVFGSRRCDCGEQLEQAMALIAKAGRGVVVYLRGHEGRGIGLSRKLRAYDLQDSGLDTVDANLAQGLPVDSRDYGVAAQILRDLGVREITLMTNNPAKCRGLTASGVRIARRVPLVTKPNLDNVQYLTTKRMRMHHAIGVQSRESSIPALAGAPDCGGPQL
jgi:3,4-dihydroxy 2-butanone 4-phosphate synthase/GTP cyclohydrolase II